MGGLILSGRQDLGKVGDVKLPALVKAGWLRPSDIAKPH